MKTRKVLSFAAAAVMALASLPVLSAAAENHIPGDVDMDGVLTGHDTAMVSRYIFEDGYSLTEEQLSIADVDGDGAVDQADNEWMHANEVYAIGNLYLEEDYYLSAISAYYALLFDSLQHFDVQVDVAEESAMASDPSASVYTYCDYLEGRLKLDGTVDQILISPLQYNLLDGNADGVVDFSDAGDILCASSYETLGLSPYMADGCYAFRMQNWEDQVKYVYGEE